jgi:hypothetical protein
MVITISLDRISDFVLPAAGYALRVEEQHAHLTRNAQRTTR